MSSICQGCERGAEGRDRGLVTNIARVTPQRGSGMEPIKKNTWKLWRDFCAQMSWCYISTFATHFTTTSPQKSHHLHPLFPKTPSKNADPPRRNYCEKNRELLLIQRSQDVGRLRPDAEICVAFGKDNPSILRDDEDGRQWQSPTGFSGVVIAETRVIEGDI